MPLISLWWKGDIFFIEYAIFHVSSLFFLNKSPIKKSKQRPHHAALMYLYVMQIYSYLNCQIFFFFLHQTWTWQHHYPAQPSLLFICQSFFFSQKSKFVAVSKHAAMYCTCNHFSYLQLRCERWGGGLCVSECVCACMCASVCLGNGASLLVSVYFSSSIHLFQTISIQSSEEQNLISTCGTEWKDTETLSRCIYLWKAVSLSWLIWITDSAMLVLHTVAQMAKAQ